MFWKELSNAKGGKVERSSRIKYRNGRLAQGEGEVRMIWKEYFEDLYMCGFDGIQRGNYFG